MLTSSQTTVTKHLIGDQVQKLPETFLEEFKRFETKRIVLNNYHKIYIFDKEFKDK